MENSYEQGFAFILEAATELAFYDILLNFLAERHPECKLEKRTSDEIYEPFYVVQGPFGTRVIRMNNECGRNDYSNQKLCALVSKHLYPC